MIDPCTENRRNAGSPASRGIRSSSAIPSAIPRRPRVANASRTCSIEPRSAIGPVNIAAVPYPAISNPPAPNGGIEGTDAPAPPSRARPGRRDPTCA